MSAAAVRVVLAPPEPWDDARILAAARTLALPSGAVLPGDDVGGLVVLRVEPESGAVSDANTTLDVVARPRPREGPLHVALLLDASQSMATPWNAEHSRLDAAREALLAHLRAGGAGHSAVSLFTFAREARLVAGPFAPGALKRGGIDVPAPAGRARTANALNTALAHLAAQGHDGTQAIVLLSDGGAEPAATRQAAARAARLGIPIHVVAFAPQVDPLYEEVASASGGTAQRATLPLNFDIPRTPT